MPFSVIQKFREMTATKEDKLMKKLGLEEPIGTPTKEGLDLLLNVLYKENRDKLVKIAQELNQEEETK